MQVVQLAAVGDSGHQGSELQRRLRDFLAETGQHAHAAILGWRRGEIAWLLSGNVQTGFLAISEQPHDIGMAELFERLDLGFETSAKAFLAGQGGRKDLDGRFLARCGVDPLVNGSHTSGPKKDVKTVSAEAMTALINYEWPGNVRELEHAVERAAILVHGSTITLRELPPEVAQRRKGVPSGDPLNLRSQERDVIRRALDRFKGNRKRTAAALNISTVTLWRKMKEYDLTA